MNVDFSGLKHYVSNAGELARFREWLGQYFDAVAAEGRDEIAGELQLLATVFESWLKRIEPGGDFGD